MRLPRLPLRPSSLEVRDCSTCALSRCCRDGGHDLFVCTHDDVAAPESAVQLWRGSVAELDASGWPTEAVPTACPGWVQAWGSDVEAA